MYTAFAPLITPTTSSPIIRSLVVAVGPSMDPILINGDCGSEVSLDSYTP